jgi:hypothetical protein
MQIIAYQLGRPLVYHLVPPLGKVSVEKSSRKQANKDLEMRNHVLLQERTQNTISGTMPTLTGVPEGYIVYTDNRRTKNILS